MKPDDERESESGVLAGAVGAKNRRTGSEVDDDLIDAGDVVDVRKLGAACWWAKGDESTGA
jgi:hypothetical protein